MQVVIIGLLKVSESLRWCWEVVGGGVKIIVVSKGRSLYGHKVRGTMIRLLNSFE